MYYPKMTRTEFGHIVLRVPTPFFENLPEWLTTNFTIIEGGKHNGQASRNKLIIFSDGTYLELFNWYDTPPSLDDETKPMRVWGPKQDGLIDFALTSTTIPAEECMSAVNDTLSKGTGGDAALGVRYQDPIYVVRKRPDGIDTETSVSRPVFQDGDKVPNADLFPGGRLDVPFFCHDVTERQLRIPSSDKSKTTHPCGATGIAACEILVPEEQFSEYTTLYSNILGSKVEISGDETSGRCAALDISRPEGLARGKVIVRAARSEYGLERMKTRGIGFSDLIIETSKDIDGGKRSFGSSGIESTLWLETSALKKARL